MLNVDFDTSFCNVMNNLRQFYVYIGEVFIDVVVVVVGDSDEDGDDD